jgi:ActR/RegA family two-component response regulator
MHVLVVEDEEAIRSALVRSLGRGGTTVAAAATLAEARALAVAARPDALISDLKLPDGSGLDLARELGVPIILMTGYGTFDDAVAALRLGAIDFFTKPVALRDLRHALERVAVGTGTIEVGDPVLGRAVSVRGDQAAVAPFGAHSWGWTSEQGGRDAFRGQSLAAPRLDHRRVLAELCQLVPAGRVDIERRGGRWTAWLDTGDILPDHRDSADAGRLLESLATRVVWLTDGGVVGDGRWLNPLPPTAKRASPGSAR